ncbi:MAG: T9SS type A sorting domain-containing protein [Cyclobacteriaceae bacterium]
MIAPNTKSIALICTLIFLNAGFLAAQNRFVSTSGTDVGPNDCTLPGSPCLTIQHAIDEAVANDVISVSDGIYRENITISKSVTLQGNNSGTSGTASRSAETIIQPGVTDIIDGRVITVTASDVVIDGFTISGDNDLLTGPASTIYDALQGIYLDATSVAYTGLDIQNNILEDFPRDNRSGTPNAIDMTGVIFSSAIMLEGSASGTTGHAIKNNLFRDIDDELSDNYADFLGYGIILQSAAYADISRNKFTDVGCGMLILGIPKISPTDSLVVDSLYMSGGKVGMVVLNGPTHITADSVTIVNPVAFGIRVVGTGNNNMDVYLTNSSITGASSSVTTMNASVTNYSGFASEKYNGTGIQSVYLQNSVISDNRNRGITLRGNVANGTNIGVIERCTIEGNSYDGFLTSAFGIITNRGAELTISESFISNSSANRTATVYDALIGNNNGNGSVAGLVDIRSCSILATTGTKISSSGTNPRMDASGNYWGTTSESTIAASVSGTDITPWISSGTDTEPGITGFQPDLSVMNIGLSRRQTGSIGRIQEGITNFPDATTLVINSGTYASNPTVDRDVTFQPLTGVQLEQITMNGTGIALTVDGDMSISNSLTMTDGDIEINPGSTLTLLNGATNLVESSASRVEGALRYIPDSPLLSTDNLNFLGFSLLGGNNDLVNLSITRISGTQGENTGAGGASIAVSWDVSADNTPDDWTVNLEWPSSFDNGNGLSSLNIWADDGSGFNQIAGPVSASGDPRVTQDFQINSFATFTAADETVTLPVTLADFSVVQSEGNIARLTWSTLTELNSDFFLIERSTDGRQFFERGSVKAANNSSEKLDYEYTDTEVIGNEVFYRLKIVDLDGTFEYSDILYLQLEDNRPLIYPNPASDFLIVPLASTLSDGVLTIHDQSGRAVYSGNLTEEKVKLNKVLAGVYVYRLKIGNVYKTGKLIIR